MAERPEDLNLPNAVVSRIIKEALPPSVKVSKEAQAAVAKAASVFVLYATSCANNVAIKGHRKTINGNDVIKAMEDMEFNKFIHQNFIQFFCLLFPKFWMEKMATTFFVNKFTKGYFQLSGGVLSRSVQIT